MTDDACGSKTPGDDELRDPGQDAGWFPEWSRFVGVPAWVTGPNGRITFMNTHAEKLFGVAAADCVGKDCSRVIGGRDLRGRAVCTPQCRVRSQAQAGCEVGAVTLHTVDGQVEPRWLQVMSIPVPSPDGAQTFIVHCSFHGQRTTESPALFATAHQVQQHQAPRSVERRPRSA